ncbi:hypothetical protein ACVIGB_006129 [Bradyrhizobium sp. USDA 4341]
MRIHSVGWAFFGLALLLAGYVLNRGILVGSHVTAEHWPPENPGAYLYYNRCNYLHLGGVHSVKLGAKEKVEAESFVCQMFDDGFPPASIARDAG